MLLIDLFLVEPGESKQTMHTPEQIFASSGV